jgi:broad specificity phosphatase PhoE
VFRNAQFCSDEARIYISHVQIRLIRHAQPSYVTDGILSNDPPLTQLGRRQAQLLAQRDWGRVDEIWVSPMVRARQTAEPIAERLGIEPITRDWMHEIEMPPAWEGSPVDRFEALFEELNLRAIEDMWEGVPGGESFRDFHERISRGLNLTLKEYAAEPIVTDDLHPNLWTEPDDASILYVAHGGTNAVSIGHLLGADPTPWEWDRFDSAHTSVATIRTKPVSRAIAFGMVGFGDTSHLPPDEVTR